MIDFAAQIKIRRGFLRDIPPKQKILIDAARKAFAAIQANEHLTVEGRTAAENGRRAEFDRDSAAFTAHADKLLDQIEGFERAALGEPPASTGTVEERLLAEMRAERFWAGALRELDASGNPFAVAESMLKSADLDTRRTLMEELPAYLRANGHVHTEIESMITDALVAADPALAEVRTLAADAHVHTSDSIAWNARLLTRTMNNLDATKGMPAAMWPTA